jgi:hypothetical protein
VDQVHVSGRPCELLGAPLYKKSWREAHLELHHSLPNKFLGILQFIFIDHLLRNLVEGVRQLSDYHLHGLIALIANREEHRQQHMTIMTIVAM